MKYLYFVKEEKTYTMYGKSSRTFIKFSPQFQFYKKCTETSKYEDVLKHKEADKELLSELSPIEFMKKYDKSLNRVKREDPYAIRLREKNIYKFIDQDSALDFIQKHKLLSNWWLADTEKDLERHNVSNIKIICETKLKFTQPWIKVK